MKKIHAFIIIIIMYTQEKECEVMERRGKKPLLEHKPHTYKHTHILTQTHTHTGERVRGN